MAHMPVPGGGQAGTLFYTRITWCATPARAGLLWQPRDKRFVARCAPWSGRHDLGGMNDMNGPRAFVL